MVTVHNQLHRVYILDIGNYFCLLSTNRPGFFHYFCHAAFYLIRILWLWLMGQIINIFNLIIILSVEVCLSTHLSFETD